MNSSNALAGRAQWLFRSRKAYVCLNCRQQATSVRRLGPLAHQRSLRTRPHEKDGAKEQEPGWLAKSVLGKNDPLPGKLSETSASITAKSVILPQGKGDYYGDTRLEDFPAADPGDERPADEMALEDYEYGGDAVEGYVPATTWHGLRSLKASEWDGVARYDGFVAKARTRDPWHVDLAIQRACVEVFAKRQEETPLQATHDDSKLDLDTSAWSRLVTRTTFETSVEGQTELVFQNADSKAKIINALFPATNAEKVENIVPTALAAIKRGSTSRTEAIFPRQEEISEPNDKTWQTIPLEDPELKFFILKRSSQLLGMRLLDPQIMSIRDVGSLRKAYMKEPKPKKLAQELLKDELLADLTNVEVSARRKSPVNHDKDVGRLKLINDALREKRLPLSMR